MLVPQEKVNIIVDIETLALPISPEEIAAEIAAYEPAEKFQKWAAPKNYKDPAKIEAHRLDWEADRDAAYQAFVAKAQAGNTAQLAKRKFRLAEKRMISVALGIADTLSGEVRNVESKSGESLDELVSFIISYLNDYPSQRLIGWNSNEFDLPEIAKSMALVGKRPRYKPSKWDLIDLCKHPFRGEKLKDAAAAFGFTSPDEENLTGADVQRLYDLGDWAAIEKYNRLDVVKTGRLFLAAEAIFTLY